MSVLSATGGRGEAKVVSNVVRVLHHGDMILSRSSLVDAENGPAASPGPFCAAPSFTYLIETPDGTKILFDAAISRDHEAEWPQSYLDAVGYRPNEQQRFEASLKAHGLGPEDIDIVFLSHLHCDHAGNARLFSSVDASIIVHEREYAAASALTHDLDFYVRADFDIPAQRFTQISGNLELAWGVQAISLPGHTAGSMGLVVETERAGTLILTSDACYLAESYDRERCEARAEDRIQWLESMHKLKTLARERSATIIFGHDHAVRHGRHCGVAHEDRVRRDIPYS